MKETLNKFGLRNTDLLEMEQAFRQFPSIQKVILFGSRANKKFKKGSDIDIAVLCTQDSFRTTSDLHRILDEETGIPYFFDVIDYSSIESQELKHHLNAFGVVLYER